MNSNNGKPEKTTNIAEICLLCGGRKQEKRPICGECNNRYTEEGCQHFIATGEDLSFQKWLLQKAKDVLPTAEKEYEDAKAKVDEIKKQQSQVDRALKETSLQSHLSDDEFDKAVEQRKMKLWNDNNGSKCFGDMKRLEDRARLLPKLISQLEDQQAAKAAKAAAAGTELEIAA